MPVELMGHHPPEHRLEVGDVVMVTRPLTDKETGKPFTWRYFAVVTGFPSGRRNSNMVFEHIILDDKDRQPTKFYAHDFTGSGMQLWYLPEDEWPDGVYVFRTKLILEGKVDGII